MLNAWTTKLPFEIINFLLVSVPDKVSTNQILQILGSLYSVCNLQNAIFEKCKNGAKTGEASHIFLDCLVERSDLLVYQTAFYELSLVH